MSFYNFFWRFLKPALIFEAAGAVVKIASSLKLTHPNLGQFHQQFQVIFAQTEWEVFCVWQTAKSLGKFSTNFNPIMKLNAKLLLNAALQHFLLVKHSLVKSSQIWSISPTFYVLFFVSSVVLILGLYLICARIFKNKSCS